MIFTPTAMTPQTLAQRLTQGRIPVAEALRYSMMLADALRKLHDGGRAHGAVSPSTLNLTAAGLDLLPAPAFDAATPYKAPEVLDGHPADARSDIFSFGAVVYEMLTGKRAFEGTDRGAMAPSGSPAVDRLVGGCLAKDPSARIQRLQKIMLELKLLSVSASRAAAPAVARRDPGADAQLRAEIQHVEARIAARLQANEKALAEMQRLAGEVLNHDSSGDSGIRTDMLQLEARVAGRLKANEKVVSEMQLAVAEVLHAGSAPAPDPGLRNDLQQMEARFTARLAEMDQRLTEALGRIERLEQTEPAAAAVADTANVEQAVEGIRRQVTELHDLVAEDFLSFEKSLQAQATAIDSARTAMAQTDDLVERVVEALESLQSTVLENSEERALAIN
jgi:hypothetical protein